MGAVLLFPAAAKLDKPCATGFEAGVVHALCADYEFSPAAAREVARRFCAAAAPLLVWGSSLTFDFPELQKVPSADREELRRGVERVLDEATTQLRDLCLGQLLTYELWLWQFGAKPPPKETA
jgi:hypothetical protein